MMIYLFFEKAQQGIEGKQASILCLWEYTVLLYASSEPLMPKLLVHTLYFPCLIPAIS